MMLNKPRYHLLGSWVNGLTMSELNDCIRESINQNCRCIIANHNLHSIFLNAKNSHMREFFKKTDYIHIDGMPIVWLGNLLGHPLKREHRTTYADWIWSLSEEASRLNWRIFYLGSQPGIADKGAAILQNKYPGLDIKVHHGYFDITSNSQENEMIIESINNYKPHILMVGMSMPRQECWISNNLTRLSTNVILPSGAAIDYVAQVVPTPPRWAGRMGLEWFFRFISEPKRLGRRYFVEPIFVLTLFVKDVFSVIFIKSHLFED